MEYLCITDATKRFGISSKTLRYYEQMGILTATRLENNKYRYYDADAMERIKQILILRKMQIPIKDIIRIYESEDMSVVVEVFASRISAIDEKVTALSELKGIINEFLQVMIRNGINKISALPLLYEEMDKQLELLEEQPAFPYGHLEKVAEKLQSGVEADIIELAPMRVLTSKQKKDGLSNPYEFWNWLRERAIPLGAPGCYELFEYQEASGESVFLQKIDDFFDNDGPYADTLFEGGLFAVGSVFVDEDLSGFYRALINSFFGNPYYEVDYLHSGCLRHETLIQSVLSPDDKREKIQLLLPVKRRLMNEACYDPNERVYDTTVEQIEAENPVLWTKEFPIQGEREYLHWIYPQIATGIMVQYPFRVDIEFRIEDKVSQYAWDGISGVSSVLFQYGDESYGVNTGNNADKTLSKEAISFSEPVVGTSRGYPGLGRVDIPGVNHLTWVVGPKHFAVILNGKVRYCGVQFPYMKMELDRLAAREIIVDSYGLNKVYFSKILVSQLKTYPKLKLPKGAITMVTKQSNNQLPHIRGLNNGEEGKNYGLDDCLAFLMECAGDERGLDYWTFAGITGDSIAQVYNRNPSTLCGYCVSGYLSGPEYLEYIFDTIGYEHTYVTASQINANKTMYLQTVMAYIDKGMPVLVKTNLRDVPGLDTDVLTHFLIVGYEDEGKTLLFVFEGEGKLFRYDTTGTIQQDWVFMGNVKEKRSYQEIVRKAVQKMPAWLTWPEQNGMFFGAAAFRAWADDIEQGRYDNETDLWSNYGVYICNLATNAGNSGKGPNVNDRLIQAIPEYQDMWAKISEQYVKLSNIDGIWKALEDLGGGFNVTLNAMRDKDKRAKIAGKLREAADCMDTVLHLLQEQLKS